MNLGPLPCQGSALTPELRAQTSHSDSTVRPCAPSRTRRRSRRSGSYYGRSITSTCASVTKDSTSKQASNALAAPSPRDLCGRGRGHVIVAFTRRIGRAMAARQSRARGVASRVAFLYMFSALQSVNFFACRANFLGFHPQISQIFADLIQKDDSFVTSV